MMPILDDMKKYLEMTEEGYKVKENCPYDKLEELKQINDDYSEITGEQLIKFDG